MVGPSGLPLAAERVRELIEEKERQAALLAAEREAAKEQSSVA